MNAFSRSKKHIRMDRVKEMHEAKYQRQLLAEKKEEKRQNKIQEITQSQAMDWRSQLSRTKVETALTREKVVVEDKIQPRTWRKELHNDMKVHHIQEGMTSQGLFFSQLPATGDVDISITSMDASSFQEPENVSFDSGTNSGFTGGFSADNGIMNFTGDADYNTNALTNEMDLSQVDTVNISAIAGNNSNGGMLPSNDLKVLFLTYTDASDEFTVISKTSSSFSNTNISIPQEFRKSGVSVFLFSTTGEFADQGQHLKPFTISINGLNHGTMGSIPFGVGSETGVNNLVSSYLQKVATTENYRLLGQTLWVNIQNAKNGFSLGPNPNYGQPGEGPAINLNNWDPAPVSGNRNENGTAPDADGNDAPGVTDADYIYIGQHMFDTYKNSKLYGVSNISLRRRTPINVFVSLDSPEATSFIRTDSRMMGLSAKERRKKLEEMLKAGDKYMLQQLGFSGTQTQIADTGDVTPWEQAQHNPTSADDYTGGDDPLDWADQDNDDLEDDTGFPDLELAAAGVPRNTGGKSSGDPNNIQWPRDKYPNKKAPPGPGVRMASYEPQGEVISEKKKLKSVKDITKKIPGYYDGKPSPTGFPMEPPPKLVKLQHPELTSGDRAAKRFNKLDPATAKAMPKTAYPHIDKKVQAAAKKPK